MVIFHQSIVKSHNYEYDQKFYCTGFLFYIVLLLDSFIFNYRGLKMLNTNDLKKGTQIMLKNGWAAVIYDNKKGNTRLAEVDGIFKEIGSIYSHDIDQAFINNAWVTVSHTKKQKDLNTLINAIL
jgi:hypothetical protein